LVEIGNMNGISTSERSHLTITCYLSEVEMNVESDILPTFDPSEVPKNFDAFAL